MFSGEIDVDSYNNYGIIKKPDEEQSDTELNNNIESYVRERPIVDRNNANNTKNNKNNKQANNMDEDMELQEAETNEKNKKSKKGKKKDFSYKIPEFQEAKQRYEVKQAEIAAAKQAKAERLQKLDRDKQNRSEMKKKLAMKTSKGQPIMKNQVDLLLSKLQKKS